MKKQLSDQKMSKRITRLGKAIMKAYAVMAMSSEGGDKYFTPINKLIDEISFVFENTCAVEIFNNLGLYAFICAAHENFYGIETEIHPDARLEDLSTAIWDLSDAGYPAPGHTQFWDWVAELRRRPRYWNNGSENRTAFQLNPWEWVINWDELDWEAGFDIADYDGFDGRLVIGYRLEDCAPVYLEYRDDLHLWIAGEFENFEKEFLSTGWRNPFAAAWFLQRLRLAEDQGASAP